MKKREILEMIRSVGFQLPQAPVVQNDFKTHCTCGRPVKLVCEGGLEFDPAYYVCVCGRVAKVGTDDVRTAEVGEGVS